MLKTLETTESIIPYPIYCFIPKKKRYDNMINPNLKRTNILCLSHYSPLIKKIIKKEEDKFIPLLQLFNLFALHPTE
jgi:hypothetical protein